MLLPFIRTKVVGKFTASKVNPETWGTGELVTSDEAKASLEKQVTALLT